MADPQDVAQDWAKNLRNARSKIERKVKELSESPTARAARNSDVWQQRVSSADAKKKFEENLRRVSLEDWRNAFVNKGLANMASGADASVDKFANFLSQLLPYTEQVKKEVADMKVLTIDDAIAKVEKVIRKMSEFKYKRA
jgi:hypothetical protein